MDAYQQVANTLQELGITFDVVELHLYLRQSRQIAILKEWKESGLSPCF